MGTGKTACACVLICEAAGFDVGIVETVGVGQSETAVAEMCDLFMLLLAPAAGDELQGIKKGIVELADLIVVNKADGDLVEAANHAVADYQSAVHMIRPASPNWRVPVLTCSAHTGAGIANVWQKIDDYSEKMNASGECATRRANQAKAWMWSEIEESLIAALRVHPDVAKRVDTLEGEVAQGARSPGAAAREMLSAFLDKSAAESP